METIHSIAELIEQQKDVVTSLEYSGKTLKFLTNSPYPLKRVCTLEVAEPETIAWLNAIPSDEILWDIGANMGIFTLYAAVIRNIQVYSFEPEASNYALLSKNIQLNNLADKVTALCCGLSNENSIHTLFKYCDFESSGINSVGEEVDAHLRPRKSLSKQTVITFTGDELANYKGFSSPQHIKIDVDGIEHLIISGLHKTLKNNCKSLLVELNLTLPEHREVVDILQGYGFKTHLQLTEDTRIKNGYWKDMVNMIFSRDDSILKDIAQNYYTFTEQSTDYHAYQLALSENRSEQFYQTSHTVLIECLKRK
ncbi:FkbM family methyltransferase [Aeromonas sobria]|uniref:FkbM family methyltransferase n=1 Tax=Aeromonas sobria TaxID=646 RepID=UPI003F3B38E2